MSKMAKLVLKDDWYKNKRCHECGYSLNRSNCAMGTGGCDAWDPGHYDLDESDYETVADGRPVT